MNALVWNKGRWSLHLFPMTKSLRTFIDGKQARFLRRILKVPAAYIGRITGFHTKKFAAVALLSVSQRLFFAPNSGGSDTSSEPPPDDPLRRVFFEPHSPLRPARPPSITHRDQRQRVGRPSTDWAQSLLREIYRLTQTSRADVERIAQDRRHYHLLVERLCELFDRS